MVVRHFPQIQASKDSPLEVPAPTITFSLADRRYLVKQPAADQLDSFQLLHADPRPVPCVVVTLPLHHSSDAATFLREKLQAFADSGDDVYHPHFAEQGCIVLQLSSEKDEPYVTRFNQAVAEVLRGGRQEVTASTACLVPRNGALLPEGPYVSCGRWLHQAWRLFDDHLGAFMAPTVPRLNPGQLVSLDGSGGDADDESRYLFDTVGATSSSGSGPAVAVPSRLYLPPASARGKYPLWGKRIAVKDNIHMAGIKTTVGSRSYTQVYGPQPRTADFIKLLVDLGAVIIGKTHLIAFAGSDMPPNQAIDYPTPWNPRADGLLIPSGSSSGSGSCVAGYDWCDFAIGTDTSGSTREPARRQGLHGMKLTTGIVSGNGLVASSDTMDAFGLLTRSIEDLILWANLSTQGKLNSTKMPKRIIYATDWPDSTIPEQARLTSVFVAGLEKALHVKHERLSLGELWDRNPPVEAGGKSLDAYIGDAGWYIHFRQNYLNMDQFRQDYITKFGTPAYVSPCQRWKWDLAVKITSERLAEAQAVRDVVRGWVERNVLTRDAEGHGEAIVIIPLPEAKAEYRDARRPWLPSVFPGLHYAYFPSILGVPQIITPVGQTEYESPISERKEYIPVTVSIIGVPGSDVVLAKVMESALRQAGLSTSVCAGRNAFPVDS